jgi:isopentenyl diphosphate isomerase/L-lactate dehydrogenase-like FMN-dependent dehydrogenase
MSKPPSESLGMQRQFQIYLAGLQQQTPERPVAFEAMAHAAEARMTPEAFAYVAGGAGSEDTMTANREAFRRWRIVPRMMRDVARRDLSVELFGRRLPAPILFAPIGVLGIVHEDAEVAVACAARTLGLPQILSTVSSKPMESVAEALGETPRWFQLYWGPDRDFTVSLLRRAEAAGFGALVVTLDTKLLAWRERDLQGAYLPFLFGDGLANYFTDPVFRAALPAPPEEDPVAAVRRFSETFSDPSVTWFDLAFLREHTRMPILVKGIVHPDDARQALDHGVDGIIVSNHGGRQVDGALGALDALAPVVEAVRDRVPVLFDSGIRRGADVFKALALGAKAVLLGRPYVYGLALGGEAGVRDVALNLMADFDLTLALCGCASVADVCRDHLVHDGDL